MNKEVEKMDSKTRLDIENYINICISLLKDYIYDDKELELVFIKLKESKLWLKEGEEGW